MARPSLLRPLSAVVAMLGLAGPATAAAQAVADELPYRCAADTALAASAPTAAADTLGWGGRVARAFPGWRLAVERDIACYFDGERGFRMPKSGDEPRGAGRAWWLLREDMDGDGRPDVVTYLVPRGTAPSARGRRGVPRLILAAFHADGRAFRIAALERRGFYESYLPYTMPRAECARDSAPAPRGGCVWNGTALYAFVRGRYRAVHTAD